jgi:hypothetical protein
VERGDAGLEHQADHEQPQAQHQQGVPALGDPGVADGGQLDAAGGPVDQRQAVEEEGGGEGAEQEVLDRRLLGQQPATAGQPGQQVQRQAQHLQRHEHDEQVVGGGEQHHPADGEAGQRVDLGLHPFGRRQLAVPDAAGGHRRGGDERRARRVQRTFAEQEHRQRTQRRDRRLEEQGRAVDGERAAGGDLLGAGEQQRGHEGAHRADQRDGHLHRVPHGPGRERLDQDPDRGGAEDEQQRRERRVGDGRGGDGPHQSLPPFGTAGLVPAGSEPTSLIVAATAGSMRLISGCG